MYLARLRRLFLKKEIPILLYHQISEQPSKIKNKCPTLSPEQFRSQMAYLYQQGYSVVSLDSVVKTLLGKRKDLPEKSVVLTFDDGYLDNYTNAFPVLCEYGFTATIFIVSGLIGKKNQWDGGEIPLLSKDNIREMAKYRISFGCHSLTHPHLLKIPQEEVKREMSNGKAILEDLLGEQVRSFAYPYGEFNEGIKSLVPSIGFESACSVNKGMDIYSLRRILVFDNTSFSSFRRKISGYYLWYKKIRSPWRRDF